MVNEGEIVGEVMFDAFSNGSICSITVKHVDVYVNRDRKTQMSTISLRFIGFGKAMLAMRTIEKGDKVFLKYKLGSRKSETLVEANGKPYWETQLIVQKVLNLSKLAAAPGDHAGLAEQLGHSDNNNGMEDDLP